MARISGIDLPREKRIEIGLTYIYGIGLPTAQKILERTGIDPNTRVKNLTEDEEKKLRDAIDGHVKVEGDLRREVAGHIKRLTDIGCYRGLRHRRRPARAWPTHQDQRPHPQGPEEDRRREEKGHRSTEKVACEPFSFRGRRSIAPALVR